MIDFFNVLMEIATNYFQNTTKSNHINLDLKINAQNAKFLKILKYHFFVVKLLRVRGLITEIE